MSETAAKSFPKCIDPLEFMDKLERADGLGEAEFKRVVGSSLDKFLDDSFHKFSESLKDEKGQGITTDKFFDKHFESGAIDDLDLDETAKEMENSITDGFT